MNRFILIRSSVLLDLRSDDIVRTLYVIYMSIWTSAGAYIRAEIRIHLF